MFRYALIVLMALFVSCVKPTGPEGVPVAMVHPTGMDSFAAGEGPRAGIIYVVANCSTYDGRRDVAPVDYQIRTDTGFEAVIYNLCTPGQQDQMHYWKCDVPLQDVGTDTRVHTALRAHGVSQWDHQLYTNLLFHQHALAVERQALTREAGTEDPYYAPVSMCGSMCYWYDQERWTSKYVNQWPGDSSYGNDDSSPSWSNNPACTY